MDDLFGGSLDREPPRERVHAPRPWFGCDTYSEAWRNYCEAWTIINRWPKGYRRNGYVMSVKRHRGERGMERLRAAIEIVEKDVAGMIADRTTLDDLLG